ncbi:cholecystokinin receptor type A-like [Brevipalpus obovatus]|uniref:cholecystokinin receptor type A-like n=1 Tax=Brevipalpus obovatus TaxID=246614 RepID=UPI003D9F8B2D
MNFSNISSPIVPALDGMADCIPDQSSLGGNCIPGDGEMLFMTNPEEILDAGRANPAAFTIVITHAITFIIGVIGNVVVILTWAGRGKLRSPTTAFLVSLAASDLLLLLVYVPLEILTYFALSWNKLGSVCKISSYVEMLCGMSSVLNLVAVSVERFLVIVYPIKARRLCTLSTSRRGLLVVWSLAIILALPVLFVKQVYAYTYYNNTTSVTAYYCLDDENLSKYTAVYQFLVIFLIPGTIMLICYFCVIQELWVSTRTMASMTKNSTTSLTQSRSTSSRASISTRSDYQIKWPSNKHERIIYPKPHSHGFQIRHARKQVIKMLIFVVLIFFLCWGPRLVLNILLKYTSVMMAYDHQIYSIRVTCYLLSFIHSALNPFIYGFMSSNFRRMMCFSCSHSTIGNSLNYTLNTGSCSMNNNHHNNNNSTNNHHHNHHIIGLVRSSVDDSDLTPSSSRAKIHGQPPQVTCNRSASLLTLPPSNVKIDSSYSSEASCSNELE